MIFDRGPKRDYWAWREAFAWRPMRVDRRWVWLERYKWRHAVVPEKAWPMPFEIRWAEDFRLSSGYTARRVTTGYSMGLPFTDCEWMPIPPDLKIAA